jgi:hypothetical protein
MTFQELESQFPKLMEERPKPKKRRYLCRGMKGSPTKNLSRKEKAYTSSISSEREDKDSLTVPFIITSSVLGGIL